MLSILISYLEANFTLSAFSAKQFKGIVLMELIKESHSTNRSPNGVPSLLIVMNSPRFMKF